jgi:hypothetical protein
VARKNPTTAELLTAQKYRLVERIAELLRWPLIVASAWVPLTAMQPLVHDLAGKDTKVNAALSITVTWGLVASAGWGISAAKGKGRAGRLEKSRNRADSLEAKLMNVEEEVPR